MEQSPHPSASSSTDEVSKPIDSQENGNGTEEFKNSDATANSRATNGTHHTEEQKVPAGPGNEAKTHGNAKSALSFPYENFDCELADCKEYLDEHGVAVLPEILSQEEIAAAQSEMFDLLEHQLQDCNPPFDRDNPATWKSFQDLTPLHGMLLQHFEMGQSQFVWNVRQHPRVAEAFAELWGVEPTEMLTSYDGLSIHLPPEQTNRGFFMDELWFHVDQSYCRSQFECIQGFITLWDVEEGDATLACWPQSQQYHEAFGHEFGLSDPKNNKNKGDWQKFGDDPVKTAWLKNQGLAPRWVKAAAGSLVLWDSRTVHQGIQSVKGRTNPKPRCVVYVCQKPRYLTSKRELKKKQEAFLAGHVTNHWPYPVKAFPRLPRTRGKTYSHIKLPFQKPERLEPFWKPEAKSIFEKYCSSSALCDQMRLKRVLEDLRMVGFEPDEELHAELMDLASNQIGFEGLYYTIANEERPELTELGKRLAGFD